MVRSTSVIDRTNSKSSCIADIILKEVERYKEDYRSFSLDRREAEQIVVGLCKILDWGIVKNLPRGGMNNGKKTTKTR